MEKINKLKLEFNNKNIDYILFQKMMNFLVNTLLSITIDSSIFQISQDRLV